MIAWADCITVTIARPRATASPPILIYICAPFRRERHGVGWLGPKVPVRHRNQLLSNVGSKFRAWARNNPATFRWTTFGRGTGHEKDRLIVTGPNWTIKKKRWFRGSSLFCWRPRRDLNPCYRRERAMS